MVNQLIPVAVECYSGYTFAERPMAFVWEGRRYRVERVLRQWRSPDGSGFRVLTFDGAQFQLAYDKNQDRWFLHLPPGAGTALPRPGEGDPH